MSEKQYMLTDFDNDVEMLEKINEQQSLIQSLKEEIRLLKPTNIEQYEQIVQLQDEIDKLKRDIDIYEYEEKKHSETVRKLYEENEQLRNSTEKFWNVLTGFCEYVVTDERRIKQLKYDFRPLVLSYWITITEGSDE